MPSPTIRRRLAAACAVAAAVAVPASCGGDDEPAPSGPNIVLITTDDQALDSFNRTVMPQTTKLLVDEGTVPTDFIVTTPLCCPSRASLLTGQYGHNNGVLANRYELLHDPESTLPVWLQEAGYQTVHVGKYLNNYEKVVKDVGPAPGWDDWATVVGPSYYDYSVYGREGSEKYGSGPDDYLTRVITADAVAAVQARAGLSVPFFLQVDYYAPHEDPSDDPRCGDAALPDPRDSDRFADARLPQPPSFNEADVSDKPPFLRRGPLSEDQVEELRRRYGCELASLGAVDRGVGEIAGALEAMGVLEDTVLVYMSDNGWLHGQHGYDGSKHVAYAETLGVSVAMRIPDGVLDAPAPRRLPGPTANIDIAPTLLDLAGGEPCTASGDCLVMDGRSLVPALDGSEPLDPGRSLVVELDESADPDEFVGPCAYRGLRTGDLFYLEHDRAQSLETGECVDVSDRELYDLRRDPFELENLLPPGGGDAAAEELAAEQAALLDRLEYCQGIAGRDPQPPAGISYCE